MKHVLYYVEDCNNKLTTFKTKKALNQFIDKFHKKHTKNSSDAWINLIVYDVSGEVTEFKDIYGY